MTSGGVQNGACLDQNSDDAASARTECVRDVHEDNPIFLLTNVSPVLPLFLIKTISPILSPSHPTGTGAPRRIFRQLLWSFILGDGQGTAAAGT